MDFDWTWASRTLIGLLAIVNPLGAIPIFMALTFERDDLPLKKIVKLASLTVVIGLLVAAFFGPLILQAFGISVAAFRVGGGILILMMGLSMLQAKVSGAKHREEEAEEAMSKETIGVVPLGVPLLAGPGSISLVIVETERISGNLFKTGFLVLSIFVVALAAYICLSLAPLISARLGKTGVNVFTRIMGLIITAIAVGFITEGLGNLLPGLAG